MSEKEFVGGVPVRAKLPNHLEGLWQLRAKLRCYSREGAGEAAAVWDGTWERCVGESWKVVHEPEHRPGFPH